jgi:hypothetical protein
MLVYSLDIYIHHAVFENVEFWMVFNVRLKKAVDGLLPDIGFVWRYLFDFFDCSAHSPPIINELFLSRSKLMWDDGDFGFYTWYVHKELQLLWDIIT